MIAFAVRFTPIDALWAALREPCVTIRMIVAASLLLPTAVDARSLWERPWLELRTPHLTVVSSLPEDRSIDLVVELEEFHRIVDSMSGGRTAGEVPTTIVVLPQTLRDVGFTGHTSGYFRAGLRTNYVVLRALGRSTDMVVKHWYTPHLLAKHRNVYPPWITEGMAEVLETIEIADSVVHYGKAQWLGALSQSLWLSYEDILSWRSGDHLHAGRGSMYFAQAWLLMHYLMLGREASDLGAELSGFMSRMAGGDAAAAAFSETFGISLSELPNRLRAYTHRLRYAKATLANQYSAADVATRLMDKGEVATLLGLLSSLNHDYERARRFYDAARDHDPNSAGALVGMAALYRNEGRFGDASSLYERAIGLEPDVSAHLNDYGAYFLSMASNEPNPAARRQWLVEARRQFTRSYQIDPGNAEALFHNGLTYLLEGEDAIRGVQSLEAAYELLPYSQQIQLALARAYLETGDLVLAEWLLQRVVAAAQSDFVSEAAELLTSIDRP